MTLKYSMVFFFLQLQHVSDVVDISKRTNLLEFCLIFDCPTQVFQMIIYPSANWVEHFGLCFESIQNLLQGSEEFALCLDVSMS